MKLESQDYDLLKQEQKEQEDREYHEQCKTELTEHLIETFNFASKDGLSREDKIACIVEAFRVAEDTNVRVDVVSNQVFRVNENLTKIDNYTHKDLEPLSFEEQLQVIGA